MHPRLTTHGLPAISKLALRRGAVRRWGLVCLLCSLVLGGCTTGDRESDAFFGRGWIWPKELDQPREQPPPTNDSVPPH